MLIAPSPSPSPSPSPTPTTPSPMEPYANGVPSSSPGLRGTRYPGTRPHHRSQPQRGCAPFAARFTPPDGTALRFGISTRVPRVGLIAFDQPWAGGRNAVGVSRIRPSVGWKAKHRWRICIRPSVSWRTERRWRICIRPTLGWRPETRWANGFQYHRRFANDASAHGALRQRRFILQPRVARDALPWDASPPHVPTATRLRPVRRPTHATGRNRVAVRYFHACSHGRSHCIRPTLGWRTIRRWRISHSTNLG